MTDKVQKIREEVERLKSQLLRGACSSQIAMETRCKEEAYDEVLTLLDSLQEEPNITGIKSKHATGKLKECIDNAKKAKLKAMLDDALSKETKESWNERLDKKDFRGRYKRIAQSESFKKAHEGISIGDVIPVEGEEPVSNDFEMASKEWLIPQLDKSYAVYGETKQMELTHFDGYAILDAIEFGANWQKAKDKSVTKDLGEYINELSKQFPEVSFAKLSRITVRAAKWQKENLWKHADGDDLPEYDREVIVLINYNAQCNIHDEEYPTYRVGFGHRPNPNGWDGKNIDTNVITHYTPKLYDKGGWNAPNIVYWLDARLPYEENKIEKEIEL